MKKLVKIFIIIALILVGLFGATSLYIDRLLKNIETTTVISSDEAYIADEFTSQTRLSPVVNIALFGADHDGAADDNTTAEDRSDAIKVVSLNYATRKIKITSLERDLVVWLPGIEGYDHLNHDYWRGGGNLAIQTINYNFDLDITHYVTFSYDALEKMVDAVDGVDIELTAAEANFLNADNTTTTKHTVYEGKNHLDGYDAMQYCRIRSIDSDYGRMERQNNVIKAVIKKCKSPLYFIKLGDICDAVLPYVTTNMTTSEIKKYLMSAIYMDISHIETYQIPSGGYQDTASSYIGGYLLRSYTDMLYELHRNIYGENTNYSMSETTIENEKRTYATFGYPF